MLKVHSSRRVRALRPSDYDHEIGLVNHDEAPSRPSLSVSIPDGRPSTTAPLIPSARASDGVDREGGVETDGNDTRSRRLQPVVSVDEGGHLAPPSQRPSIEIQANAYHKTSPTSISTAQVPDPSWEWVWPEWRIFREEGTDSDGWVYSFAFSNKFSWHSARWWNSFVRRRAWIRKRARRKPGDTPSDPHMLTTDYFTVLPASQHGSVAGSSHDPSKPTNTHFSSTEVDGQQPDIENVEALLQTLRRARIDREKTEAVDNYLTHAIDLSALQDEMHEIMSLFIYQASRKQLLGHLIRQYAEVEQLLEDGEKDGQSKELMERKEALDGAVKHAEEEVRRLAYWSDVKQMANHGELVGDSAVGAQGWSTSSEYQGLDRSGPAAPDHGKTC